MEVCSVITWLSVSLEDIARPTPSACLYYGMCIITYTVGNGTVTTLGRAEISLHTSWHRSGIAPAREYSKQQGVSSHLSLPNVNFPTRTPEISTRSINKFILVQWCYQKRKWCWIISINTHPGARCLEYVTVMPLPSQLSIEEKSLQKKYAKLREKVGD